MAEPQKSEFKYRLTNKGENSLDNEGFFYITKAKW